MTFCKGADVRARFRCADCVGLGWRFDFVGIGARVRAPALSRRLSSFLFAGWLSHAKYASWGCLGLTRGDRRCRSQFSEEDSPNRRRRPGHRLVCRAFVGRSASSAHRRGQAADRPDEPDEFPRDGGDHDRRLLPPCQHLPTCAFHAMERISPASPSCRRCKPCTSRGGPPCVLPQRTRSYRLIQPPLSASLH